LTEVDYLRKNATLEKERMKAMQLKKGKLGFLGIIIFSMDHTSVEFGRSLVCNHLYLFVCPLYHSNDLMMRLGVI
jgi:hypothetical protein